MSRASDLKIGNFIRFPKESNDNIYNIADIGYSMQGRGSSSYELNMRVVSGKDAGKSNVKKRLSASDKVEILFVEEMKCEYLYSSNNSAFFMDAASGMEQIEVGLEIIGKSAVLLEANMPVKILLCESRPIAVKLPERIEVVVEEADPVVKGQTAAANTKNAVIKKDIRITVPQFIETGDSIIINAEDLTYVSRAQKS